MKIMKKIRSIAFFIIGLFSLGMGIAGTILPVLPGGPFYLFAAFCFAKSSKKMDTWFKNTSIYSKYVEPILLKTGMTRKEKIRINCIADLCILISIFYIDYLFIKIILLLLALYKHYYFIKKIKTIPPKNNQSKSFTKEM
ncbi:YbaN family protein [Bacillus weihaiensis]|nr:YbaN family protein [Bacillus weihaiensis]